MGDVYTNPPQSRNEAILRATIDGTGYTAPPQSRIEDLLLELKEAIEQGGGAGGMSKDTYDPDDAVADAGGIAAYVDDEITDLHLGTASTKNSTSVVTSSSDLVESGAVKDIVGWGNKNKLPYFTEIKSISGVTVTPSNGRYSFTGTATDAVAIKYPVTLPINSGVYRFIADGYGYIANSNISLYYNDNGTTKALAPNETIDLSLYPILSIAFFAGANVTVNYQNIGLMLVKESESDKSFEPYHESVEEYIPQVVSDAVGWDYTEQIDYSNYEDKSNTSHALTATGIRIYSTSNGTYRGGFLYIPNYPKKDTLRLITDIVVASGTGYIGFYGSNNNSDWTKIAEISSTTVNTNVNLIIPPSNYVYYRIAFNCTMGTSSAGDVTFNNLSLKHDNVDEQKADNSVIAPVENGTTASQAYAVRSHFIRDGKFCTVTTAISSGESLVGSSKFTSGDVASELFSKNGNVYTGSYNDYTTDGIYFVSGTLTNLPEADVNNCVLMVKGKSDGSIVIQTVFRATASSGSAMYIRRYANNAWSSWYKYEGTIIS